MLSSVLRIRQCCKLFNSSLICSRHKYFSLLENSPQTSRGYVIDLSKCSNKHVYKSSPSLIIQYSSTNSPSSPQEELDAVQFERISDETLESLTEYFDEVIEQATHLDDADVSYGVGVLTIKFGGSYGTYVINRQSPNKQIWLSSPTSGPKRYDFIDGTWIYKHDGKSLHELLDEEIPKIIKSSTSFEECAHSKRHIK